MQLVKLISVDKAKLNKFNLITPIYSTATGEYEAYGEIGDLQELANCTKAPSNDSCLAFVRQLPTYVGALIIDESCIHTICNKSSRVKLQPISPNYNWRDIEELYNLLLVVWENSRIQDSNSFLYMLMCGAYGNKDLFKAYTYLIPASTLHAYILAVKEGLPFKYEYPFDNPVPRLHYARDLLSKDNISHGDILNVNRALHEAQQCYYPPVLWLDYTGLPVHRTFSQYTYRKLADWMYLLYSIKDAEYRYKRYSSVSCEKLTPLIIHYLKSLYNDLAKDHDLPLITSISDSLDMRTRALNLDSDAILKRKHTKLFACSRSKEDLKKFMQTNKIVGDISTKFVGICNCYFINQNLFETIKGKSLSSVEECMKKFLDTHTGVYWTAYKDEP